MGGIVAARADERRLTIGSSERPTLDAICAVCGAHCATWVGENEHGDRHYTLDACEDSGDRFIVHSYDLMEAVYELAVLLGCDLSDV